MSFSRVSLRPKAGPDAKVDDDLIASEVAAAFCQLLLPLLIAKVCSGFGKRHAKRK